MLCEGMCECGVIVEACGLRNLCDGRTGRVAQQGACIEFLSLRIG